MIIFQKRKGDRNNYTQNKTNMETAYDGGKNISYTSHRDLKPSPSYFISERYDNIYKKSSYFLLFWR
jgi:hypothetical protein